MTLDAYPGDAEIRRRVAAQQLGPGGIALGPDSPLRDRPHALRSKQSGGRKPHPGSTGTLRLEHDIQKALFVWTDDPVNQLQHPELAVFYAIPTGGHRMPAVAAKMKAEGVKPGVCDCHLPVARGEWHSLYIELKRPGATLKPEQPYWLAALARYGNRVAIHTDWESARDELLDYLALSTP